jgi:hypothetical protein
VAAHRAVARTWRRFMMVFLVSFVRRRHAVSAGI